MWAMFHLRFWSASLLVGVVLWLASLGLYLSTLAPTLAWGVGNIAEDGGELLAAARTLGVPHPSGYPTYMLLLKGFAAAVPVGDFAFRGNLLSAVLASASVALVYWATLRLCRHVRPAEPEALSVSSAALGAAAFAASPLLWSQATVAEVYALNAFFAAALLALAAHLALQRPAGRQEAQAPTARLALFGLLLGLGLGNHLTLLAVAVPLLYWLGASLGWRRLASPAPVAALALGLAVYAYIPLRAAASPPVNWGHADTPEGFLWLLTGGPYRQYVFGVPADAIPRRVATWARLLFEQFNALGIFIGLVGIAPMRLWTPRFLVASAASIAILSVYALTYNTVDFEVLLTPAYLLFSAWMGLGFFWMLANWLRGAAPSAPGRGGLRSAITSPLAVLTAAAFLAVPVLTLALNYGSQDLSHDRRARDFASSVMESVPNGSVVVSTHESDAFALWYARYVEQPQRDVTPVVVPLLQFDWYRRDLHALYPDRIPALLPPITNDAVKRIVEHNNGDARVFFTYRNEFLMDNFNMERVGAVYEATPRAVP